MRFNLATCLDMFVCHNTFQSYQSRIYLLLFSLFYISFPVSICYVLPLNSFLTYTKTRARATCLVTKPAA